MEKEREKLALVYGEKLAQFQFMVIKRVPACSSDCLVSEGTRQRMCSDRLRRRQRDASWFCWSAGFSPFKWLSPAESGLAQISAAIPCWVKASKSADLNLFSIRVRSGCFPQRDGGKARLTNSTRLHVFRLNGSSNTSRYEACEAPFPLSLFRALSKPGHDHSHLPLTPTYVSHKCTHSCKQPHIETELDILLSHVWLSKHTIKFHCTH